MKKVIAKLLPTAPDHVLLVLDGNTGQNALVQAEAFSKADVSGFIVTKLDGSSKGGFVALAEHFAKPLYFVGLGEQPQDLKPLRQKPC